MFGTYPHPLALQNHRSLGRQRPEPSDQLRSCFERDAHRILHAKPFRRLRNKTQVFFAPKNDHISTRMDHSLFVATIAQTICRNLGLNDDLAFAAALGHDLGHSPFGHAGEKILADLLSKYQTQPYPPYIHEAQSLRVVDRLCQASGHDYKGLNLTFEVRDAIRCHCGESIDQWITPRQDQADPSTFIGRDLLPMTLEGCVVRMADRIAYLGRDYEDAVLTFGRDFPPLPAKVQKVIGTNNREFIATFVRDVIDYNRRYEDRIGFSDKVYDALLEARAFNYREIYYHEALKAYGSKVQKIIQVIFKTLWSFLERYPPPHDRALMQEEDLPFYLRDLVEFIDRFVEDEPKEKILIDHISLMTDGYAFEVYKEIVLPKPIV